ncbi:MAG: ABC transporter transmembrane domain-containing protein [Bacilli bacterium]
MENKNVIKHAFLENKKSIICRVISFVLLRIVVLYIPIQQAATITFITEGNFDAAFKTVFIIIWLFIANKILIPIENHFWWKNYRDLYKYLVSKAVKETFKNSLYSFSRFNFSIYSNIITKHIEKICNYCAWLISRILTILEFIYILGYFYYLDKTVSIISIVGLIICMISYILLGKKIEKANSDYAIASDVRTNSVSEIFSGFIDIKNYNLISQTANNHRHTESEKIKKETKISDIKYAITSATELFMELIRHLVYLYGIWLIMEGKTNIGSILIIYNYYSNITANFNTVTKLFVEYGTYKISLNRYNELFLYSQNLKSLKSYFNNNDIKFTNVIYGDKNNPKLQNVNFDIEKNKITVINGNQESGVEGVFELLERLNRPHEGEITIGNINIDKYDSSIYSSAVCAVNRNPMFFNISIKDNLMMINQDFEKVQELCKIVGIHKKISNLTNGYDTILNSDCSNISIKNKYLLEVVRCFLAQTEILLFDDIFSVLDNKEIEKIIDLISLYKNQKTIIIRTNNKKIIKLADKIITFEQGNKKSEK